MVGVGKVLWGGPVTVTYVLKLYISLSHSLVVTRRRRSHTTISIFEGIGTKEAISASTAGARPAATGRVVKQRKPSMT